MTVLYHVLVAVVVLGILTLHFSLVRSAEQQRDDWKAVADELAMAVRMQPQVVIKTRNVGTSLTALASTPETQAASRALARYNALLEPEA